MFAQEPLFYRSTHNTTRCSIEYIGSASHVISPPGRLSVRIEGGTARVPEARQAHQKPAPRCRLELPGRSTCTVAWAGRAWGPRQAGARCLRGRLPVPVRAVSRQRPVACRPGCRTAPFALPGTPPRCRGRAGRRSCRVIVLSHEPGECDGALQAPCPLPPSWRRRSHARRYRRHGADRGSWSRSDSSLMLSSRVTSRASGATVSAMNRR